MTGSCATYASSGIGDIARLNYAKRLFAVPIAVLGQATGQASLPFFARLFNEKRLKGIRHYRKRFGLPCLRPHHFSPLDG
jgi:peptidoglycan biosynthesis protein MviN/MurJ (putative lipid II flippase)